MSNIELEINRSVSVVAALLVAQFQLMVVLVEVRERLGRGRGRAQSMFPDLEVPMYLTIYSLIIFSSHLDSCC